MLFKLIGTKQKSIAWFLFLLFNMEMLSPLYASNAYIGNITTKQQLNYHYFNDDFSASSLYPFFRTDESLRYEEEMGSKSDFEASSIEVNEGELFSPLLTNQTLLGGPGQPEMSSFKPAGADNMVDLFSGDFSYNVPLLDVDGYPINIFYNAGISADQEASWVGLGWNINPGSVSRNMRGVPDDFDGSETITKTQSIKPEVIVGVNFAKGKEIFGEPKNGGQATSSVNVNWSLGALYNSKRGFGLETSIKGEFTAHKNVSKQNTGPKTEKIGFTPEFGLGLSLSSQDGLSRSLSAGTSNLMNEKKLKLGSSTSIGLNSRTGLSDLSFNGENWAFDGADKSAHNYGSTNISFARSSFTPSITMPMTNLNATFTAKLGKSEKGIFKNATISGYYVQNGIAKKDQTQKRKAFGYMYFENAEDNENALFDFNRLNDGVITLGTAAISVPVYTYDIFSISGEGISGSFRGYRGNMGFVHDPTTKNKTGKASVKIDLGGGDISHVGLTVGGVYSPSESGSWDQQNFLKESIAFKGSEKLYQGFYFRNPQETAIIDEAYYEKLGEDQLIRPMLGTTTRNYPPFKSPAPALQSSYQVVNDAGENLEALPISTATKRLNRDKRTQVISFLTAEEADKVGLDRYIYAHNENSFKPGNNAIADIGYKIPIKRYDNYVESGNYRKRNHISEISVLEESKRYVYGLPVYQIEQESNAFSIAANRSRSADDISRDLVSYTATENSTGNNSGRDHFYESEKISAYAHSYLLTAILSPDYSDLTGDGITDDDLGTAIKFNYSRANKINANVGSLKWIDYKWRMPMGFLKANYNKGLNTDSNDDKALFSYGSKELWYTHSIESKNMIATFRTSDRRDGMGVLSNDGLPDVENAGGRLRKLDRIDLFTKADFLKYGNNAKPVKSVHFEYDYTLCGNYPANDAKPADKFGNVPPIAGEANVNTAKGKLTLKSIWFTYNNNGHQQNKYLFKYGEGEFNPVYNTAETDRWGTYKKKVENLSNTVAPPEISNEDFPYTHQSPVISNRNAAAWNLQKILVPAGAEINVEYEADDYAFVQDRRAATMVNPIGFGLNPNSPLSNKLYNKPIASIFVNTDFNHVYFNAPVAVFKKSDIERIYLKDFKQILLKLWVKVPKDSYGEGYEPIFIYCNIKDYGVRTDGNGNPISNQFWVKIGQASNSSSQIMQTVSQYLREQLPSKAYPGYDIGNKTAVGQVVKALYTLMYNYIPGGILGFENMMRLSGWCKEVDLSKSVVRLTDPTRKKIGGGHRVKKVLIKDNWNRMTGRYDASYGQEYSYTTEEQNGATLSTISSGVASYEPGIGNDENPFREILQYNVTQPLGPTNYDNLELPFAEMFYPNPNVGYSKVKIRSINNRQTKGNIKSATGLQEHRFYTCKDFPTIFDYTQFDEASRKHFKSMGLTKLYRFNSIEYLTMVQGFRAIQNNMNGKLRFQASYAEQDLNNPISSTEYFYRTKKIGENKYRLDNVVPVVKGPKGEISNALIGKDIEVMNDFREHYNYTYANEVPLNINLLSTWGIPLLIPTIFRSIFRDEKMFRSATTLKVVNEYGILDKVVNIDKGSVVETKNILYDAETGAAILNETNNSFKKPIFTFTYPSHWAYPQMGPAYKNIDAVVKNVVFRNGKLEQGLTPSEINNIFESGDEIYVDDSRSALGPLDNPGCISSGQSPVGNRLPKSDEFRIWVLDVRKDVRNTEKEFIFIDRYGNPYNAADADIKIIRSGRRNMLGAAVGSVRSLNSPIKTVANLSTLEINNNANVLESAAASFKEKWKTQDAFYIQYSPVTETKYALIHSKDFYPKESRVIKRSQKRNDFNNVTFNHYTNKGYFLSSKMANDNNDSESFSIVKSWMKFDLGAIPAGSTITEASLFLLGHNLDGQSGHNSQTEGHTHQSNNPHQIAQMSNHSSHRFYVGRMMNNWDASEAVWNNNIFNQTSPSQVSQAPAFSPPTALFSSRSYSLSTTQLVKDMIRDKYIPERNFTPAFYITHSNNTPELQDFSRFCFHTNESMPLPPPPIPGDEPDVFQIRTKLTVKYYDCADPDNTTTIPTTGEYAVCNSTTTNQAVCMSVLSKTYVNPYVMGLVGNWRPFKSYVFYSDRRETNPAIATNIVNDGVITDFASYWNFDNQGIALTTTSNLKWKYNNEVKQYNRKGAEIEQMDPLNRFNSGIFGYNESLPVAVVNNSRVRLSAFDGFEDYFYKDWSSQLLCNPNQRHFDTKINTAILSEDESHTGLYSLKTNENSNTSIKIPVSNLNEGEMDLEIKLIKTLTNEPLVVLAGTGLRGLYERRSGSSFVNLGTKDEGDISYTRNRNYSNFPFGINNNRDIKVNWTGKLQVTESGSYKFTGAFNDRVTITIKISGTDKVVFNNCNGHINCGPKVLENLETVQLTAGVLYDMTVYFEDKDSGRRNTGMASLLWKTPYSNEFRLIPSLNLYSPTATGSGTIITANSLCTKVEKIKANSQHLIDKFNLIPNTKMIGNIWVKKGNTDCHCAQYEGFNIDLKRVSNGSVIASFQPKGPIIEGWQQFEIVFVVPSGETEIDLVINNSGGGNIYVDDLRFHPENANMKSFAFNPYHLKPMAELDENNYATFYEYDNDGTLIRVKKETVRGIKTIQETRSSLQKNIMSF